MVVVIVSCGREDSTECEHTHTEGVEGNQWLYQLELARIALRRSFEFTPTTKASRGFECD